MILKDVSNIDMSTTILGQRVEFPICIAPTAMQKMAHPDGELATAKGEFSYLSTGLIWGCLRTIHRNKMDEYILVDLCTGEIKLHCHNA